MNQLRIRPLVAFSALVAAGLSLWVPGASAAVRFMAASHAAKATCSQISEAQVQPLIDKPITKVTVKPETSFLFNGGKTHIGQQCIFAAGSGDSNALSVTVVGGPLAAKAYAVDVESLRPTVSVPGVGTKAIRQRVDSNGAVGTSELSSIKGNTYCSVVPQEDDIPGVGQLEEAAGATADIGDKAYAEIASVIGTVCNRVYGSGSTKPDLSGFASITVPSTTTTTGPLG